jgi:ABC-type transport system involved in multi-copper enzyme maturation permease subunit
MSITLPTFTRREAPLLGRRNRVMTIVTTGIRQEIRRPFAIFAFAVGSLLVTVSSIIVLVLTPFIPGNSPVDVSYFYASASSPAVLFFVTLMAASGGAGLIADDRRTMALSLYLSRPITPADYLGAKAFVLAALISTIAVLPLLITPLAAALLGLVPWGIGLEALGIGLGLGLLLTAVYTSVTLFLSSLSSRRAYAAAAVFALTFGLTVPVGVLADSIGQQALRYVSPWDDYLAVARAAFGSPSGALNWIPALLVVLVLVVLTSMITYARIRDLEVSTE